MACESCECPEGNYSCSCCCASVTGLRGGIHPDHIKSIWRDIHITDESTQTYITESLLSVPVHIVSITASLACVKRNKDVTSEADMKDQILEVPDAAHNLGRANTPVMFSLFTIGQWHNPDQFTRGGWNAHEDTLDGRMHCATGSLTPQAPSWTSPPDLFGYFCDGGLHVEMNAPTEDYGIRIVLNYIERLAFSPAYGDPVRVLKHYWSCAHGEVPFLKGYYGGVTFKTGSSGTSTAFTDPLGQNESFGGFNPFYSDGQGTLPIYEE